MRIGIDGRVLDRKITGTGRYLINLLNELPNVDKKNEYYLFTNSLINFDEEFYNIVKYKESGLPLKLYSPYWINVKIPRLVKEYNIDLLFMPNVFAPLADLGATKCIAVIHDSIYKIFREYYPLSWRIYKSLLLPYTVRNSDLIITVSQQSKLDLIKYDHVPEKKIRIVYNTASKKFSPIVKSEEEFKLLQQKLSLPDKYLLYVGVIENRKNVQGIIKIIDSLRLKGSSLKAVLIGKEGYNSENVMTEIEKRKDCIKHFYYMEDEYLTKIYNYAFAFIFPSYYEGFGIPPLEAMQCGTPVLSSNTSSLKEVVNGGGITHDPDDHYSFIDDILRLEKDADFYSKMKSKALEQSKKFDIEEISKNLVNIFNEIA